MAIVEARENDRGIRTAAEAPGVLVMFDGECNLCSGFVDFCLRRDPLGKIRFLSRQSAAGQALLRRHDLPSDLESMVVVEGDRVFIRSDAALRAFRHLRMPWPLLSWLSIVPRWLRNPAYRIVARSRYRLFGHRRTCRVPTEAERSRFVE
ncbi:MAG: thiol-disulfide oxidoreductase DCC family protein [Planctomycetota bacterium]